jgi:hypothetical protein
MIEELEKQHTTEMRVLFSSDKYMEYLSENKEVCYDKLRQGRLLIARVRDIKENFFRTGEVVINGKDYSIPEGIRKYYWTMMYTTIINQEDRINLIVMTSEINYIEKELKRVKNYENPRVENDLSEIKAIPIESILEYFGSRKRGKQWICPIHNEHTPSLYMYTNTNSFNCFGCHVGGTVIDLVMGVKQCTFQEAIEFLRINFL